MRKFNGFESKIMGDFEQLPVGGYVCEIKNAEVLQNRNGGERLEIAIDISEGDYRGFYAKQYKEDTREDKKWRGKYVLFLPNDDGSEKDGWAKNRFNNVIGCVEDANDGYHWDWDEKKLRGKKIALVFRREEYEKSDGGTGWTVKPFKAISIGNCRDGKWGRYEDKPLNNGGYNGNQSLREIDPLDDSDLPFSL
jgi:hypothetical protein